MNINRYEDKERYEDCYECEQNLELRLPLDMVHLQRILTLCSASLAAPSVRIHFELKDPAAAKDAAFAAAVQDAKHKALAVARAAEVQLGEILHIDIGEADNDLIPPTVCYEATAATAPPSPKDLSIDATVNVLWAIS